VKIHLIKLLSKFRNEEINRALEMQLGDTNKLVRSAALTALAERGGSVNIAKVSKLLHDPDLDVQNKAVDVMVRINHPETIRFLVPALKDESEYTRRAAVEVLNEIGNADSVKDLLQAIKDDDWWVRARAGDALAEIGGPKVVDSVLQLIRDKDEDIRRTAIKILNATKDPRAVDELLKATDDTDWWVRERAVDALSQIGSPKAVPKLVGMLGQNPKTDSVVIRALGKLGDHKVVDHIPPLLKRPEREVQVEAIKALSHLVDQKRAESVRNLLHKIKESGTGDSTIINIADKAIKDLDAKYSATVLEENVRAEKIGDRTHTLLIESEDVDRLIAATQDEVLDISKLQPGDVIDGRYKFIEKIGKGAFGTVLLMEDQVVDERLILKFLN